jgi:hypothetical protein
LKDPTHTVPSTFNINVQAAPANNPPSFSEPLSTQTVTVGGSPLVYALPTVIDPESDTYTISSVVTPGSWCTYDGSSESFTIAPPIGTTINTYIVTFNLKDPTNTVPSTFNIVVLAAPTSNTAPTFGTALVPQSTPAGTAITYTLPSCTDA